MNPFRNEFKLELGGQEIILRPTFQNIAALEAAVGSLAHLAYAYSKGMRLAMAAKAKGETITPDDYSSTMPKLTEMTAIVFHCQAEKKFTIDEIWDLVQTEGISVTNVIIGFIAKITNGGDSVPTEEKKS